jgi:hypothetical protein
VVRTVAFSTVPRVLEGVVVSDVGTGLETVVVKFVRGVWGFSHETGEREINWVGATREDAIEVFNGGLRSYSWSRPGLRHLARLEAMDNFWREQVGVDEVQIEGDAGWEAVVTEGTAVLTDPRAGKVVVLEFALAGAGERAAGAA